MNCIRWEHSARRDAKVQGTCSIDGMCWASASLRGGYREKDKELVQSFLVRTPYLVEQETRLQLVDHGDTSKLNSTIFPARLCIEITLFCETKTGT